jgi:hypothetical protein
MPRFRVRVDIQILRERYRPFCQLVLRLNINQPGSAQVVPNGDSKGKVPVKTEHDEQHFRIAPAARGLVLPSKPTALPMRRRSRDDRGVTLRACRSNSPKKKALIYSNFPQYHCHMYHNVHIIKSLETQSENDKSRLC